MENEVRRVNDQSEKRHDTMYDPRTLWTGNGFEKSRGAALFVVLRSRPNFADVCNCKIA